MSNTSRTVTDRRAFLKGMLATSMAAGASSVRMAQAQDVAPASIGARNVVDLVVPKLDTVRVGVIGIGARGGGHLDTLTQFDGVEIVAICDSLEGPVKKGEDILRKAGRPPAKTYTGSETAYREMLDAGGLDAVFVITPWEWHAPMAVDAMRAGAHAFVEVPLAVSVEECWQLVDVAEQTQRNCMMLENVCYGREEMMVLDMVHAGVLGELTHGEGAYIHDLRSQMKSIEYGTGSWRTHWHTTRDGNLYPTHGLGPIAQYMDINRGDRFDYMTSMSSPALGRKAYAAKEFPADHARNKLNYINGDMSSTLIKTALGRTILLQHDTTTPRPYTRLNLIQGTAGTFRGFPHRAALEVEGDTHHWSDDKEALYGKHEHLLWREMRDGALKHGGHGGMDFIMLWRVVYCLRNGMPLDQDVYDGAAWSVITELSHDSVNDRSRPCDIPDFTRGQWEKRTPLEIIL
jgi:predicted dehydrogenase